MLKVKIHKVKDDGLTSVLCILAWDEEKEEVVILKGKQAGQEVLEDKYLDKRTKTLISAEDGKSFIVNLPFSLTGSRVYAGKTYEED